MSPDQPQPQQPQQNTPKPQATTGDASNPNPNPQLPPQPSQPQQPSIYPNPQGPPQQPNQSQPPTGPPSQNPPQPQQQSAINRGMFSPPLSQELTTPQPSSKKHLIIIAGIVLLVIIVAIVAYLSFGSKPSSKTANNSKATGSSNSGKSADSIDEPIQSVSVKSSATNGFDKNQEKSGAYTVLIFTKYDFSGTTAQNSSVSYTWGKSTSARKSDKADQQKLNKFAKDVHAKSNQTKGPTISVKGSNGKTYKLPCNNVSSSSQIGGKTYHGYSTTCAANSAGGQYFVVTAKDNSSMQQNTQTLKEFTQATTIQF